MISVTKVLVFTALFTICVTVWYTVLLIVEWWVK